MSNGYLTGEGFVRNLHRGVSRRLMIGVAVVVAVLGVPAVSSAVVPGAAWGIHLSPSPTSFSTGDTAGCEAGPRSGSQEPCDAYQIVATDIGSLAADGSTVSITDTLPAGLTVRGVKFFWSGLPQEDGGGHSDLSSFLCTTSPVIRCELPTGELGLQPVAPDSFLRMFVYVSVNPGAAGPVRDVATVSGGGVPDASTSYETPVSATPAPFGFQELVSQITGVDGGAFTQAGGHPYEFRARIDFATMFRAIPEEGELLAVSGEEAKDIYFDLPLGFLGSAQATPKCTLAQLNSGTTGISQTEPCPSDTVIGFVRTEPQVGLAPTSVESPIYNLVSERGVPAEFGFDDALKGAHVLSSNVVPTPAGYVLRTSSPGIPQIALRSIEVTLYGDPQEKEHVREPGRVADTSVALFTNPSVCDGEPLVTNIRADSWQHPGRMNADGTPDFSGPNWAGATSQSPPVAGCEELRFEPSLSVRPETASGDTPTGLDVAMNVPQHEEPGTLATPPLRSASVALPAGLSLNPAAASGLGACSEAQVGLGTAVQPACPEDSKIGTVEITTPLVDGTIVGSIYLARQDENPFHSLFAAYIVVDDGRTGTLLKVPGRLDVDAGSGQITGSFKENPQFPFSDLKLHFFGGSRGELATPSGCGTYTITSDLMPWSAPDSGPDATPSDSFPIDTGCANAFAPGFAAGAENPQAGGYSPFVLSVSRQDGEQNLSGVSLTLPPGLLGKIAGIPLCPEANVSAGTCPDASRVGSVTAGVGVGPNPFFVSGQAYLTGPYNGGPYGLVEEVPAVAGPFNLGTVVVRQSLRVDSHTAQVTAVSDPLPTILQGIPLRVRRVDVTLDRPGFTFNPTNCTPMAVTGSVTSTQGATASVSSRFQAGGCRELAFKPSFKVSTQANTSKKQGASLDVKVGYPSGPQANIGKVAVSLPKQLPARLTTIQQACLAATFNANPAACPVGSNIGVATASTPVLATPLSGPAYLVSHGGAAFPDLVLVLQGGGVTLDLVGSINIKHGVTSSAFDSVPDAPISSFELKLPEGPHSGLAAVVPAKAKGNMCGQALTMPTTLTGQNGAVVKQTTKIAVTGCAKPKKAKAKKHTQKAHGKAGKKKG
jgi:hypothetical protein